jgi:hypothetical protein
VLAPLSTPERAPPPTPPPLATAPAVVVPTPPATAAAVVVPTPVPATATPEPLDSPSPSPRPTVDPALAEEVSRAYEHYWQVRAEALFDLDPSHLPDVMAGDHLAAVQKLITELQSEGRAIQTDVEHHYAVSGAAGDRAEVTDTYISNSVYVDLATRAPLSEPTADHVGETYELSRLGGTWKVVTLVRTP